MWSVFRLTHAVTKRQNDTQSYLYSIDSHVIHFTLLSVKVTAQIGVPDSRFENLEQNDTSKTIAVCLRAEKSVPEIWNNKKQYEVQYLDTISILLYITISSTCLGLLASVFVFTFCCLTCEMSICKQSKQCLCVLAGLYDLPLACKYSNLNKIFYSIFLEFQTHYLELGECVWSHIDKTHRFTGADLGSTVSIETVTMTTPPSLQI